MSGGQFSVPIVIRMATGAGRQVAAQHSHSLENWYAHVPGIRVLAPGHRRRRARHARAGAGRSRPGRHLRACAAVQRRDQGPDVVDVDISSAKVRRAGSDVALVTYGGSLPKAMQAADELAAAASRPK
jgi:pyruvate dehydrogenase E1 component beta subunit